MLRNFENSSSTSGSSYTSFFVSWLFFIYLSSSSLLELKLDSLCTAFFFNVEAGLLTLSEEEDDEEEDKSGKATLDSSIIAGEVVFTSISGAGVCTTFGAGAFFAGAVFFPSLTFAVS